MLKALNELEGLIQKDMFMPVAVAGAESATVLGAVDRAARINAVMPLLIGSEERMKAAAELAQVDLGRYERINSDSDEETANIAARLASQDTVKCIMKGTLETSTLLKAYLNKEYGLRGDNILSHTTAFEIPAYDKLLFMTDGALNPVVNLEIKKAILNNCLGILRTLGYDRIYAAALSFAEHSDGKTLSLLDAAELKHCAEAGEFGEDVILEGPIAFDLAISVRAAKEKGYVSPVAGKADILLVPALEVGNAIGKSFTYFGNAKNAGVIAGGKVPIALNSRSANLIDKYNTLVLGLFAAMIKGKEAENV
ncbi:MAG: phosphate acyltransferase [Clostridiaceae bacterium]|nr:phosphate acyltransferase [Clostridiaceae bacterium]